jgi:Thioredoxin-like
MGRRLPLRTGLIAVLLLVGINVTNKGRITAAEPTHAKTSEQPVLDKAAEAKPATVRDAVAKTLQQPSAEVDKRAEQVLREAAKTLMAIQSIEFRAERDELLATVPRGPNIKLPDGWTGHLKDSYLFRSNGNAFRVDSFDTHGIAERSKCFTGTLFQIRDEKLSAYRESKHRMGNAPETPFPSPISEAYTWAYPMNGFRSWEELRSHESWNDLAKRARFIGEATSEGKTILTVEVQRQSSSGKAFLYSIDFDKEHGYTPVAWSSYSLPDRNPSGATVIKRWIDADAGAAGRVRIPIEVENKSTSISGVIRIAEDTLHINQPIDDDVFTLSQSRIKHNLGPYGLDEKTADFFKPRGALAERLTSAQAVACRNNQHVLLILGDADTKASQRLFDLREKDWRRPLYDYQQVAIAKNDSAATDSFKTTYPDLAGLDWPAFVVLDEAGKVLGSRSLSLSGTDTAAESAKVGDFLAKQAPEKLDAEKLLGDALARARREDKKVFLQETGIYCAPCQLLMQYWEKHQDVLDPNFIYLKIDRARLAHGDDVMKRLRPADSIGIPWIAILDADGKVLETSLGFPSTEPKDIDEFLRFLAKTAPRLTKEQLAALRSDLDVRR